MNTMTYRQASFILRRAGFLDAEIDRLYRLHQAYRTNELDQPPLDLRRLEFIRWLVTTGRLTDQLPGASEGVSPVSTGKERLRVGLRVRFRLSPRWQKE